MFVVVNFDALAQASDIESKGDKLSNIYSYIYIHAHVHIHICLHIYTNTHIHILLQSDGERLS